MPPKGLEGIRILDLTRVYAGPYCSMLFADMGAEVIKIESPEGEVTRKTPPQVKKGEGGPDDLNRSSFYLTLNRNKYGMTLNLKHPDAVSIFKRLVKISDIVLENYAPGVMKRLGIDYPVLREINPRIILASISGFGQTGPYARRVAFDIVAQAMSGLMSITGHPGAPPTKVGTSVGDVNAAVHCAFAIMVALWHREKTGTGQHVDVSMLEALVSILEGAIVRWTMGNEVLSPIGSMNHQAAPMAAFRCKDGYIIIATVGEEHWERICKAVNRPDLASDPTLATQRQRWDKKYFLQEEIEKFTQERTVREMGEILDRERVANSPILNIEQVVNDPHLNARGYFAEVEHPVIGKAKLPGVPFKMSETPGAVERPSPLLGEHNELILGKYLGLDAAAVRKLRENGVL
jgi:CoA:oxalate CoA-transferase